MDRSRGVGLGSVAIGATVLLRLVDAHAWSSNLGIGGLLLRHRTPRARIAAAALCALTVADLQVAASLRDEATLEPRPG